LIIPPDSNIIGANLDQDADSLLDEGQLEEDVMLSTIESLLGDICERRKARETEAD
jgi:hypothetical protein